MRLTKTHHRLFILVAALGTVACGTADHGEALGDHGELTHGLFAYDATLEDVLEEDEDNLKALESLGAVALSDQDTQGVIRYLERALAVNPDLPIAWNTLGVARKWHGDVDGALEAWQRAVEIDPRLLDAWYNLGRVAVDESRWATARRAFEEYVARAPAERFPAEVSTARQILERLPPG